MIMFLEAVKVNMILFILSINMCAISKPQTFGNKDDNTNNNNNIYDCFDFNKQSILVSLQSIYLIRFWSED